MSIERNRTALSIEKEHTRELTVMKFGGASLENAAAISHAALLVRNEYRWGRPTVLVLSAMRNVTDMLEKLCESTEPFEDLMEKHNAVLRSLNLSDAQKFLVQQELNSTYHEAIRNALLAQRYGVENPTTALEYRDRVLSCGERLVVRLFTAALRANDVPAQTIDSSEIIQTDNTFGEAIPDLQTSFNRTVKKINPLIQQIIVPVITGFVGSTVDGRITTLGRNTSDYSATLIGRFLGAKQIILWKEVNGLYDKNPNAYEDALFIDEATFKKVAEMNSKVIHKKAFEPLYKTDIVVFIKNVKNPNGIGTKLTDEPSGSITLFQLKQRMQETGGVPRVWRIYKADLF
jgi:aspartate kinase